MPDDCCDVLSVMASSRRRRAPFRAIEDCVCLSSSSILDGLAGRNTRPAQETENYWETEVPRSTTPAARTMICLCSKTCDDDANTRWRGPEGPLLPQLVGSYDACVVPQRQLSGPRCDAEWWPLSGVAGRNRSRWAAIDHSYPCAKSLSYGDDWSSRAEYERKR